MREKSSKVKLLVGLALISIVGLTGSILASNFSLNSGGALEFGQGTLLTTACDDEITFTPNSKFNPALDGYDYRLDNFSFSGVNLTSEGCEGVWIVIRAFASESEYSNYQSNLGSALYTSCSSNCSSGSTKFNSAIAILVQNSGSSFSVALPTSSKDAEDLDFLIDTLTLNDSQLLIDFGLKNTPIPSSSLGTVTIETYDADKLPGEFTEVVTNCSINYYSCLTNNIPPG